MRIRTAFAIISALAVSGLASAQSNLTIGDKAPALPIAGYVKGEKIDHLEKGKTYVVEFWATWCGPCIQSMPHLSDMADQFKGDVTFISVNTWDYTKDADKKSESDDTHSKRVADWVAKNTDKMRYNIVLDDAKDTISTTWMRAAGRNGIPCAFIVNDEGNITWIGHPMEMKEVLDQVKAKTWDQAKFKVTFDAQAAKARVAAEEQKALVAAIKAGDKGAVDAYIAKGIDDKSRRIITVLSTSLTANPDLSFTYFKEYSGKVKEIPDVSWCSLASSIARNLKNQGSLDELVKMCGECSSMVEAKVAAAAYMYHASVLNSAGKKDEAKQWIEKAKAAVDKYEPATRREVLLKQIEATEQAIDKK